jgi:hypothetical protein
MFLKAKEFGIDGAKVMAVNSSEVQLGLTPGMAVIPLTKAGGSDANGEVLKMAEDVVMLEDTRKTVGVEEVVQAVVPGAEIRWILRRCLLERWGVGEHTEGVLICCKGCRMNSTTQ